MSLKANFVYSRFDYIPKNLGNGSEEQGGKIPRKIKRLNDGILLVDASERLSICFMQVKMYQKESQWEKLFIVR